MVTGLREPYSGPGDSAAFAKKGSGGDKYSLALGFLGFGGRWEPQNWTTGLELSRHSETRAAREGENEINFTPWPYPCPFFLSFKG